MDFIQNEIKGLVVIRPKVFEDERGYFYESYSAKEFEANGILNLFVQDNQSLSSIGVLRGCITKHLHLLKQNLLG